MKLYIKNMVCDRCKMVVESELQKLGHQVAVLGLGEVELQNEQLSKDEIQKIDDSLRAVGFELIDDKKTRIIEKIKNTVIDLVHHAEHPPVHKHSDIISTALNYEYSYLSKLFSEVEGITIEHYIINQKIERVKELLVYDELSLTQIADALGYSSIAHLSAQFKKATGLPPSHFKNIGEQQRKALDKVAIKK
ncbi:MAG: AraC family transcriptional regulator [Sphingobacteriales bacterium]|nr:MAG: AraC family transcriptional regulator [Sphingobacteriales bacterium]